MNNNVRVLSVINKTEKYKVPGSDITTLYLTDTFFPQSLVYFVEIVKKKKSEIIERRFLKTILKLFQNQQTQPPQSPQSEFKAPAPKISQSY
jgi:hypothetical protein